MDVFLLLEDWGYDGKQEIGVFSTLEAAQIDTGKHDPWEVLIPKDQWIAYNKDDRMNGVHMVVRRFTLDQVDREPIVRLT